MILRCSCCGSTVEVVPVRSMLGPMDLPLCQYCRDNKHEPLWAIDATAQELGGMEFAPDWLKALHKYRRYCETGGRGIGGKDKVS